MIDKSTGHRCYLDTNVFILAFETPEAPKILLDFFRFLRAKSGRGVTSELTLAELLAPSASLIPADVRSHLYQDLLIGHSFIDLRPITRTILLNTVGLRRSAGRKLRLPDAIHVSTALQAGCSFLVSADGDMVALPAELTLVRPDAAGIQTVMDALRA